MDTLLDARPIRGANGLEERLERGELMTFSPCPFELFPSLTKGGPGGGSEGDDCAFLLEQRLSSTKKNINFDPVTGAVSGFQYRGDEQVARLTKVLGGFAAQCQHWLETLLPRYARAGRLDRASFRPEEEATRKLRVTARNDLLHVDAFPSRPTMGSRILRLYVNINPTEPRVWVTSDTFDKLLTRYGSEVGLPNLFNEGWAWRFGQGLLNIFQPGSNHRTVYDRFMLRFHHFLKTSDHFQDRTPKRFWHFAPGTAWLAYTDALSHGELRGRYALEHSFFIPPHALALPDLAPAAILERACGMPVLPRAA